MLQQPTATARGAAPQLRLAPGAESPLPHRCPAGRQKPLQPPPRCGGRLLLPLLLLLCARLRRRPLGPQRFRTRQSAARGRHQRGRRSRPRRRHQWQPPAPPSRMHPPALAGGHMAPPPPPATRRRAPTGTRASAPPLAPTPPAPHTTRLQAAPPPPWPAHCRVCREGRVPSLPLAVPGGSLAQAGSGAAQRSPARRLRCP